MHFHHRTCCGHGRTDSLDLDSRCADDDSMQADERARRAHAAHAHGASLILAILGGIFFFGLAKKYLGNNR